MNPVDDALMRITHVLRGEDLLSSTPRQIARFLCGLNSPSATRAKLGRHQMFGALADTSFRDVLSFVERQAQ